MAALAIELVESVASLSIVQDFCREFRLWLYERYADDRPIIDLYYNPQKFEALMADLHRIHARPQGEILLARLDGVPAGCVMHHELSTGIAEMKRMFVAASARGRGVGVALCEALVQQAKADGYKTMRLDTGIHQPEAQALYRRLGFTERDAYYEVPPELSRILRFFERRL